MLAGAAVAADQAAGLVHRAYGMTHAPRVEFWPAHIRSDRTTVVAGGMGNDGITLAQKLGENYLLNIGSVLGVRYAEATVKASPIIDQLDAAIAACGLQHDTFDIYLNSAGGTLMAEAVHALALRRKIGKVIFDSSPHNAGDIRRPLRTLLEIHFDVLKHSRAMAYLARIAADQIQPPADSMEADIPLALAERGRQHIVKTDTIQFGLQAASIRRSIPRGYLYGLAEEYIYLRGPGEDPIVNNERAAQVSWPQSVDPLRVVIDDHRPADSHAVGGSYPRGLVKVLRGEL